MEKEVTIEAFKEFLQEKNIRYAIWSLDPMKIDFIQLLKVGKYTIPIQFNNGKMVDSVNEDDFLDSNLVGIFEGEYLSENTTKEYILGMYYNK